MELEHRTSTPDRGNVDCLMYNVNAVTAGRFGGSPNRKGQWKKSHKTGTSVL
jgi:hypothetical protein